VTKIEDLFKSFQRLISAKLYIIHRLKLKRTRTKCQKAWRLLYYSNERLLQVYAYVERLIGWVRQKLFVIFHCYEVIPVINVFFSFEMSVSMKN